jgi:hypothetical protein
MHCFSTVSRKFCLQVEHLRITYCPVRDTASMYLQLLTINWSLSAIASASWSVAFAALILATSLSA